MRFKDHLLITAVAVLMLSCGTRRAAGDLEAGFLTPPDSVRVGCYWYWIDRTITRQGVIDDLHAMKRAGITRAYIGLTGGGDNLPFMSPEWWALIHTALRTATELDIEIGMFNCPGWSQSGGPWIKPNQTMRHLAAVERRVSGPVRYVERFTVDGGNVLQDVSRLGWSNEAYQNKAEDFQDVRVLAFPFHSESVAGVRTASGWSLRNAASLPARSLRIDVEGKLKADVELQAKAEDGTMRTVKKFDIDHTVDGLMRGFYPDSPVVVSFPTTTSDDWRLLFSNRSDEGAVLGVSLSATPAVERWPEKTFAKMFNSFTPPWDAYMWPEQTADTTRCVRPGAVQDITPCLAADGTLTWDVPPGEWVILRTGMLPTGLQNSPAPVGASGLEVDKLSAGLTRLHFDAYIGEILRRIPPEDRRTFKYVVLDSYEKGGQNFTDGFIDIFRRRYGYDPTPWLPAYFGYAVGSPALSDRFLWDMRRLVADRISREYVGTMREEAHRHGLAVWLENYGTWGFAGEMLQYGGASDEVGGEFWTGDYLGREEIRAASSCAHTYGKPVVWSEAFTGDKWHFRQHPAALKQKGDWAFAQGVNGMILHVYIQQHSNDDYPGVAEWYNVEFNRKNTWFSQMDMFTTYLRRCSFMLRQGLPVADVAYFIGEDAPKMSGIARPELPEGYQYDFINAEVLLRDAFVKNGRLCLPHGAQYRVLVLPPQHTMRPEVLRRLTELVDDGLILVGTPPDCSPSMENYPQADDEVRRLVAELWGNGPHCRNRGKGAIYTDATLTEVLDALGLKPDFHTAEADRVLYAHRTLEKEGTDIYFVTNQSERRVNVSPRFRIGDRVPEWWDPLTGEHRPLSSFTRHNGQTEVPLVLEPSGSAFVVFRHKGEPLGGGYAANFPEPEVLFAVTSPWQLTFEADSIHRGPVGAVRMDTLHDLAADADPHIRHYSGAVTYRTVVNGLTPPLRERRMLLDLGKVGVMAKVSVNGTPCGGAWTFPYRVDITTALHEGDNDLCVEVVTTWANRLIGDRRLPESDRRVRAWFAPAADSPLDSSGLLGPVRILCE
jgi:hypothetical protein